MSFLLGEIFRAVLKRGTRHLYFCRAGRLICGRHVFFHLEGIIKISISETNYSHFNAGRLTIRITMYAAVSLDLQEIEK